MRHSKLTRIGIVFVAVFATVIALVAITAKPGRQLEVMNEPIPTPLPSVGKEVPPSAPSSVLVPNAPKNVVFEYKGDRLSLPTKARVYSVSVSGDAFNRAAARAASLGFPQVENSLQKTTKRVVWGHDSDGLEYTEDGILRTLRYQQSTPPSPPASAQSVQQTAKSFLSSLVPVPPQISLSPPSVSPQEGEGLILKDETPPVLSLVRYEYLLDGFPLSLANYNISGANITVDNSGRVRAATLTFPVSSVIPGKEVPLLSLENILGSLGANRGLLVWVLNPDTEWGTDPQFVKVAVTAVKPVYFLNKATTMLVPAFLVDGTGTTPSGDTQTVRYFLYGYPQSSL